MNDKFKYVMNPDHPRWHEFIEKLEKKCDFKEKIPGDLRSITWNCNGNKDRPFAFAILKSMQKINIKQSFAYFDAHGGYCDCEILFNCAN